MIRRTVSAAFLLRDGFTGRTLTGSAGTLCLLDGRPIRRPVWKRDGYLVLTDLEPGEHELLVRRSGFRDECVTLRVKEEGMFEDTISLKPGAGYRFPPDTVRVALELKRGGSADPGAQLWLGVQPRTRLVIAQDKAEAGETKTRMFCEGTAALLPIPGHFLLADRTAPELVYLRYLRDENGEFTAPFGSAHPRGTELIPMQPYTADGEGKVQVLLPEPGTLTGFYGGKVFSAQLGAGAQTLIWKSEE